MQTYIIIILLGYIFSLTLTRGFYLLCVPVSLAEKFHPRQIRNARSVFLLGLLVYSPVRGAFSERTIQSRATTRSARAISRHQGLLSKYIRTLYNEYRNFSKKVRILYNEYRIKSEFKFPQKIWSARSAVYSEALFKNLRWGRDSNSRCDFSHACFPSKYIRPLCHPTIINKKH